MNFHVIQATNQNFLNKAYLLRGELFTDDLRWQDEYDPHSIHFLALHGKYGVPVGVVRLIQNSEVGLPVQKYFGVQVDELSGEMSRLGVLPEYRGYPKIGMGLVLACREEAGIIGLNELYYISAKKKARRVGGPTIIEGIPRCAYRYRP